jgi:hypothetical protein
MKVFRVLLAGLAMVIVAGTIAGASPHVVSALSDLQASASPEPSESPSPEPSESPSPEPSDVPDEEEGTGSKQGPDFSACLGLTGLENAICRHEALLVLKPDNFGLQNSLTHLQANLAKKLEKAAAKEALTQSGESHGKSGESHGHS